MNSVSDGSPEGVKTGTGLIEDDSAVPARQTPSPIPHPQGEVERVIEALAEAWASIDGKLDEFRREKALTEPLENLLERPEFVGTYIGYLSEAEEMIRRLEARGFKIVPTTYAEDNERLRAERDSWEQICRQQNEKLRANASEIGKLTHDLTTAQAEIEKLRGDRLPKGHVILEQADNLEGTVSQTVRRPDGSEYERRVDALEAYGEQE